MQIRLTYRSHARNCCAVSINTFQLPLQARTQGGGEGDGSPPPQLEKFPKKGYFSPFREGSYYTHLYQTQGGGRFKVCNI